MDRDSILKIEDLEVSFNTERGRVKAVRGVSFETRPGEIVGIVGESGCGKSVMVQSILRLLEHSDPVSYGGKIFFQDRELLRLPIDEIRKIRGKDISIIFQDPQTSLNPVFTIGNQLEEVLLLHRGFSKSKARDRSEELLRLTGIKNPEEALDQYPFELSGGMQQRVMIAMALACDPKILIADEPTTALDVTIQAQILVLVLDLNEELKMAVLFISHDLGVISEICTSVKVMYLGQIVEEMPTQQLFDSPLHPYTMGLINSLPKLSEEKVEELPTIKGIVPSLHDLPRGCAFSTRCDYARARCFEEEPPLMKSDYSDHQVKCWFFKEIAEEVKGD